MYLGEVSPETCLPGFDALHAPDRLRHTLSETEESVMHVGSCHELLSNYTYRNYLRMDKGLAEGPGSKLLRRTGNILDKEENPDYLEVAGWAFAEAAITDERAIEAARLEWLDRAERSWQHALSVYDGLEQANYAGRWRDDTKPFRFALDLAYIPLMRAMVCGDITDETRHKVASDTLAIAQLAEVHMHLAEQQGYAKASGELYGFMHECNVLAGILLLDDSTRVPLPSSSRAGSGIFKPNQTHDISLVHLSSGTIEDVMPIEAKKELRMESINRYKATIVTRTDLTTNPYRGSVEGTLHLMADVFEDRATLRVYRKFRIISEKLRARLGIDQMVGSTPEHDTGPPSPSRGARIAHLMAHRASTPAETMSEIAS